MCRRCRRPVPRRRENRKLRGMSRRHGKRLRDMSLLNGARRRVTNRHSGAIRQRVRRRPGAIRLRQRASRANRRNPLLREKERTVKWRASVLDTGWAEPPASAGGELVERDQPAADACGSAILITKKCRFIDCCRIADDEKADILHIFIGDRANFFRRYLLNSV